MGLQYVAILDLKAAYPSLPRDKLVEILRNLALAHLVAMVGQFLTVDLIRTVGNKSEWAELDVGVPQGSPLSPLLFNVYIGSLVESLMGSDSSMGRTFAIF